MSRILPIKKSLDDKFINETDVITESALTQVIENQESKGSGGGSFVEINANWGNFDAAGFVCSSKEVALSSLGLSEELFDAILDGQYANAYMKNTFSGAEGDYDVTTIDYLKPFRYVGSDATASNDTETIKRTVKFMLWDVEFEGRSIFPMSFKDFGSYGSYFTPINKSDYPETSLVGFGFFTQWHRKNAATKEDETLENVYVIFGLYYSQQ